MKEKSPCPFVNYLAIEEVTKKEGTAVVMMPFRKELTNPNGFAHGGAIASLADATIALAMVSLLGHGEFATAKMEVRFRSPSRGKTLVGESRIESNRGTFYFGKATIREEGGNVVAEAQAILSVPERESEKTGGIPQS